MKIISFRKTFVNSVPIFLSYVPNTIFHFKELFSQSKYFHEYVQQKKIFLVFSRGTEMPMKYFKCLLYIKSSWVPDEIPYKCTDYEGKATLFILRVIRTFGIIILLYQSSILWMQHMASRRFEINSKMIRNLWNDLYTVLFNTLLNLLHVIIHIYHT